MSGNIEARLRLTRNDFELAADFDIPARGITAIYGPSGAGKTTLLRIIAGLERATGKLQVGGEFWLAEHTFVPPHERRIGYVFQEPSLFDHLDVRGNLRYGLQRNPAIGSSTADFDSTVGFLSLQHLLTKRPNELSGGEQKRVAIGRALLRKPQLLLLDEPLTSLDQQHRREMLPFLERLREEARMPVLYVSHAPEEVARLADHLLLLEDGRITAAGGLNELLTRLDLPVSHSPDAGAIIETTRAAYDAEFDLTTLAFPGGELQVAGKVPSANARVRILARDVSLTLARQSDTSILNILPVTITAIDADNPGQVLLKLDAGGVALLSRITRKSVQALNIEVGAQLYAQIKSIALL